MYKLSEESVNKIARALRSFEALKACDLGYPAQDFIAGNLTALEYVLDLLNEDNKENKEQC